MTKSGMAVAKAKKRERDSGRVALLDGLTAFGSFYAPRKMAVTRALSGNLRTDFAAIGADIRLAMAKSTKR